MNVVNLFDIFTLLYLFRSAQLLNTIRREWADLRAPLLTARKQWVADQASFFVAVPIGVLIHELGHAVAIWLFGGQVVEFGYRAFWGFVRPAGTFTAAQDWFISLAGTLGNLLFGLLLWLALRRSRVGAFRYFALRAFRFQVYFALIYYPLFTIVLPIGDWATIYNFGATPIASGATAVFHAVLLGLFWWGDRVGWFEMPSFANLAEQDAFARLQTAVVENPQEIHLQLQLIDQLRRGRASHKARTQLNQFLAQNPHSGEGFLQRAALRSQQRFGSKDAVQDAETAVQLGLPHPAQAAYAHQLIANFYLDRGDGETAVRHYSQALAALKTEPQQRAALLNGRSQAYRRLRQYDLAFQDIREAMTLAKQAGDQQSWTRYREELEVLEQHAGRKLSTVDPTYSTQGGDAID